MLSAEAKLFIFLDKKLQQHINRNLFDMRIKL